MTKEQINLKRPWTKEEERFLGETVVEYIASGNTIEDAIEKVSKDINRTLAACKFRWHNTIRPKFKASLEIVKEERKKKTSIKENLTSSVESVESIDLGSPFLQFTQNLESISQQVEQLQNELTDIKQRYIEKNQLVQMLTEENRRIKRENEELKNELEEVDQRSLSIARDYKTMIEIINRARMMSLVPDSDTQSFQMDLNGNLERIKK